MANFCKISQNHVIEKRKRRRKKERFQQERHQRLRNTQITLSAFSFAAVNYQLSIVSTHFVQRQQTSTYGMISYTFVGLSSISSCAFPRAFLLRRRSVANNTCDFVRAITRMFCFREIAIFTH